MILLVTGGSASGKSEYAENRALQLAKTEQKKLIYLAAMKPFGEEAAKRIERHRQLRAGKGFETLEIYGRCADLFVVHKDSTVLLECLSNLTANIFYDPIYADKDLAKMITEDILDLKKRVKDLIMVTNEIFSDGITYDPETTCYMQILGQVNQNLAREADRVIEVVYGIPVEIKIPGVKMS